jgi:hypothetical protein
MQADAIRFKLAAHADVTVSHRGVTYRWCDIDGKVRKEDIGPTSIGRLLAKQLDAQKTPRCAADGTPYPYNFFSWTNGQRLWWLDEHRGTVTTMP